MAVMEALLKIKALVTGEEGLLSLAKGMGQLKKGADDAGKGLSGMLQSAGGLSGALGSLVPLVSGVGLAAMAKGAIDAADNLYDMSQKTGVSVETLSQFKQAAEAGGTSIEVVVKAMTNLSRGMAAAAGATDDYGETAEQAMQDATQAVKDGEDRQVEAVQDAADKRLAALEKESDDRLREINKRYKAEARLLNDSFDDRETQEKNAAKDRQQREERDIERQFEIRAKAIKNDKSLTDEQKEARLQALRDEENSILSALNRGYEKQQAQRTRQFRDAQEQQESALEERKRLEEEQIKARINTEKNLTKEHADGQVKLIKNSTKEQLADLKDLAEGPKGVAAALKELGISSVDAAGKLRDPSDVMKEIADKLNAMPDGAKKTDLAFRLMKKAGIELIPVLNGGRKSIEDFAPVITTKFAKAADSFNDDTVLMGAKLLTFAVTIGDKLMPHLKALTNELIYVANGFAALPKWQQDTILAIGGLLLVLGPLVKAFGLVVTVITFLSKLQLGATIAGWAGAAGPAIVAIKGAFAGLMAFFTGTLLPGLLAFFSGPVGWTVLAVAAVVAMAILFRKPLGQFITWLGSVFKKGWDGFVNNILKKPLEGYWKWWRSNWEKAVEFVTGLFAGIGKALKTPLDGIALIFSNTLRLVFKSLENSFNGFVLKYNELVAKLKNSAFGGILGLIPTIPLLNLPKFAKGGIVNRPTVAMVGEGSESEYIIPESKMDKALNRFMVKSQGITAGGGDVSINITTGPVVEMNGEQYVTVSDMQAAMQATARGVLGSLRNPTTRISLGLA